MLMNITLTRVDFVEGYTDRIIVPDGYLPLLKLPDAQMYQWRKDRGLINHSWKQLPKHILKEAAPHLERKQYDVHYYIVRYSQVLNGLKVSLVCDYYMFFIKFRNNNNNILYKLSKQ